MSNSGSPIVLNRTSLPAEWNTGVFRNALRARLAQQNHPKHGSFFAPPANLAPPKKMSYSSYSMSLATEWSLDNQRLSNIFDVCDIQPVQPLLRTTEEKQDIYDFQKLNTDHYPPHLAYVPPKDYVGMETLFNKYALARTGLVLKGLWTHVETPDPIYNVKTIDEIVAKDRSFRKRWVNKELFEDPNILDRDDWFSDDVFAQQQFTGTNPTSITTVRNPKASKWVDEFKGEAQNQGLQKVVELIEATDSDLYVADYSYFREVVGAKADAELNSGPDPENPDIVRYGCASVALFNLTPQGKLHPVAIIIDYKGSMEKSVTIFNNYLTPEDAAKNLDQQKNDWPWRYAKTALCAADWLHHEAKVHLVDTHLVEEVVIVATHRAFNETGPIYSLLEPHWERTLSLNKGARDLLVPDVVVKIAGIPEGAVYTFIKSVHENFDWVGGYIPNDLESRGFPLDQLDSGTGKYHNYAYARNMKAMWEKLRNFVAAYIGGFSQYDKDEDIANDDEIKYWCSEIQGPLRGNLKNFPETITTRDQLIDVLTMCIHIASPQHTAINYLQRYYMSAVINKPPAFASPLPATLTDLKAYTEQSLFDALPVSSERAQGYMLASHLPWLLSYEVASAQNLVNYAKTLAAHTPPGPIQEAAQQLENDLDDLGALFQIHSLQLDDRRQLNYSVMNPDVTAVSILI